MILPFVVAVFLATPAIANVDKSILREIKSKITHAKVLRKTNIDVQVSQRLVVLTGQVQLFEQKLVAGRLAWTTGGVYEVENEIQVVPTVSLSDKDIESEIRNFVMSDKRLLTASFETKVVNGEVYLSGVFASLQDALKLKHKIAEIQGVLNITMQIAS